MQESRCVCCKNSLLQTDPSLEVQSSQTHLQKEIKSELAYNSLWSKTVLPVHCMEPAQQLKLPGHCS